MTRVLVVARSGPVRMRLEALLARRGDLAVSGAAQWPDDAVADVVLLALEPGDEPPQGRGLRLIVLGADPLERWASRALRRGAQAVLPLEHSAAELGATLDAVLAGLAVMPPGVLESARSLSARRLASGAASDTADQPLTPRETEILTLLADGLGNRTIAARLGISGHTVKTHVESLFEKLGVSTRAEAVAAGVRRGILML